MQSRDVDALDEARSPSGGNRAALANLHESLRTLVTELRVTGVARRNVPSTTGYDAKKATTAGTAAEEQHHDDFDDLAARAQDVGGAAAAWVLESPDAALAELDGKKTGYEHDAEDGDGMDAAALQSKLDALDFGDGDDDGDEDDDDDFDLR